MPWRRPRRKERSSSTPSRATASAGPSRRFTQAYPDIKLEHTQLHSQNFAPRILQERQANLFTWDVATIPTSTAFQVLRPAGVWDPVRPAIILPEAKDDAGWEGGFERGFSLAKDRALTYGFVANRGGGITINTDLVKEDLKGLTDLLNPKWKGKLLLPDVRVMGDAFWPMTSARLTLGDDIIKKLFVDQEPVLSRDTRQMAEFMVRGRYPIGLGINPLLLGQFQRQGLGKNLKLLHFPEMDTINFSSTLWLVNRAPHPNAAKVFINWLLTKDAQVALGEGRRDEQPPRRGRARQPAARGAAGRQVLPGGLRGEPARGRQDAGHRQGRDQVGRTARGAPAPGASDTVLSLDGVSKLFGAAPAVDRASLEVRRGEVFTLLGPSGCGKTTTLRLVAGLEHPDAGEITLRGRVVASAPRRLFVPPHKRNLGMVFQSYAIWPHMTVFENVAYPLELRGARRAAIRDKVTRVLDLVGLTGLEGRRGHLLSGGQMQRLALCRALVYEPDLLLAGRALQQPRRQAAGADADRGEAPPAPPGHHGPLRHPRPDRGPQPVRPHRRHAARARRAGRVRRAASTSSPPPRSSAISSARR